jgi:hypothetical protein
MADAALEGATAYNTRAEGLRKQAAYNALSAVYGPIAGDPEAALNLQKYSFNQQNDPLLLQHQSLENTSLGQKNTFDAANDPLVLEHQRLENEGAVTSNAQAQENLDTSRKVDPFKVQGAELDVQGKRLENTGQDLTNQAAGINIDAARGRQTTAGVAGIIGGLTDAANSGADIGVAFDNAMPAIKAFYPGADDTFLASIRAKLVADPVGTLNQLSAMLQAQATTPGGTAYNAKAYGKPKSPQDAIAAAGAMEFIAARTANVPNLTTQAETLLGQMSPLASVRLLKEKIPGTAEYQFARLMDTLKGNLKLDDLRAMRSTGLSLGRVNMSEFNASGDAVGNVDLGQDLGQVKSVLERVDATYKQVNVNMQDDIKALRAGGGHAISGPPAAQPGGISTTTASNFVKAAVPGAVVPPHGGYRTPGQNKAVNGAENSMHLSGQALDFVPPGEKWGQKELDAFKANLDARHIPHTELFIEHSGDKNSTGYHIHWGWGNKGAGGKPQQQASNRAALDAKYGIPK